MGVLSEGAYLGWEDIKANIKFIRKTGVQQFINIFHRHKERNDETPYWGDEIEYMLVKLDENTKTAKVLLNSMSVLKALKADNDTMKTVYDFHPEFTTYMIEGIPKTPYNGLVDLNSVEKNMEMRIKAIKKVLKEDEFPLSLGSFPRLGTENFSYPDIKTAENNCSIPDFIYSESHPRMKFAERNIRQRRGCSPEACIPVFKDLKTCCLIVKASDASTENVMKDSIHMDSLAYGAGCCALQVTLQATDLNQARRLYDQLAALCPIMLALSAASPVYRGYLSNNDVRWPVLQQTTDDRTDVERRRETLSSKRNVSSMSRFSSIYCYISEENEKYNDCTWNVDVDILDSLVEAGINRVLAMHMALVISNDPIMFVEANLHQNEDDTDLFEELVSNNLQTVKFKTPSRCNAGWRVEFRPMEVQISSFENAAYSVFVFLLTRAILTLGLDFVIPISKIDTNMEMAYTRDAVRDGKFYFRKNIFRKDVSSSSRQEISFTNTGDSQCIKKEHDICTMTMDEIFNGNCSFPGLIEIVNSFLNKQVLSMDTKTLVQSYLRFISERASGIQATTARQIREFVMTHSDYKQDSVVSEIINYDLLKFLEKRKNQFDSS